MKDSLGQISLERVSKARPGKNRKTQSRVFKKYASGVSIQSEKDRHSQSIFQISGTTSKITYTDSNPKNIEKSINQFSFGNKVIDTFESFDDIKEDPSKINLFFGKTKDFFAKDLPSREYFSNSIVDITGRNHVSTKVVKNMEKKEFIRCSTSVNASSFKSSSTFISSKFENFDTQDPFRDENGVEFYTKIKNYYNSGNIKPFSEKSNSKNNSILPTRNSNNEYYDSHNDFASNGFVYSGNKPDSIAFGGLKK